LEREQEQIDEQARELEPKLRVLMKSGMQCFQVYGTVLFCSCKV